MKGVFAEEIGAVARVQALVAQPGRRRERQANPPPAEGVLITPPPPLRNHGVEVGGQFVLVPPPHLHGRMVAPAAGVLAPQGPEDDEGLQPLVAQPPVVQAPGARVEVGVGEEGLHGGDGEGRRRAGLAAIVGARGFEPPTSNSQSWRATELRYAPGERACTLANRRPPVNGGFRQCKNGGLAAAVALLLGFLSEARLNAPQRRRRYAVKRVVARLPEVHAAQAAAV